MDAYAVYTSMFELAPREQLPSEDHHTPIAHLEPGKPPPEHYYAENLLVVVRTVLRRYGDLLDSAERCFGARILALPAPAQRLYARLIGRRGPLIREDRLVYAEVGDLQTALRCLADAGLIERCPEAPGTVLCGTDAAARTGGAVRPRTCARAAWG